MEILCTHKILGSLPCNDLSLIEESLSHSQESELVNFYSEEQFEIIHEVQNPSEISADNDQAKLERSMPLPSTSSSSGSSFAVEAGSSSAIEAGSSSTFIAAKKKNKRKMQENIDMQLLAEIKRFNDLTEQKMKQNEELRLQQMKCH
ncbi:hypothetical protein FQR65_LT14442 [Abscondita terminalis]|nr:hypothetical protein FQR65_LT14442 [Abscondita terminalis]